MFREEAIWVREVLINLPLLGKKVANLGSSTSEFRQIVQPHINKEIIIPLEDKGAIITHIDIKKDAGVDIEADLTAMDFSDAVNLIFDLVICTNMLEHVEDISLVVNNIFKICSPNAYLLITVPRRYPLHFDPIDNGFRPRPEELSALFSERVRCRIINSKVISIKDSNYYPVKHSRFPIWGYRLRIRYWLKYYYQVTGVLIQYEG